VEAGRADAKENVLKHAPHTAATVLVHDWTRPYTREQAVYPTEYARAAKFWPSVSRIDSAYGDRNLICSCTSIEEYADAEEKLVETDKGPSY
jgi:glycine dehydrogenase